MIEDFEFEEEDLPFLLEELSKYTEFQKKVDLLNRGQVELPPESYFRIPFRSGS